MLAGFPWWPAVVFDYDDEVVPELLKAQWTRKELESEHLHIVRFFDEHDTWYAQAITVYHPHSLMTVSGKLLAWTRS